MQEMEADKEMRLSMNLCKSDILKKKKTEEVMDTGDDGGDDEEDEDDRQIKLVKLLDALALGNGPDNEQQAYDEEGFIQLEEGEKAAKDGLTYVHREDARNIREKDTLLQCWSSKVYLNFERDVCDKSYYYCTVVESWQTPGFFMRVVADSGFFMRVVADSGFFMRVVADSGFLCESWQTPGFLERVVADSGFLCESWQTPGFLCESWQTPGFFMRVVADSGFLERVVADSGFLKRVVADSGFL